MRKSLFLIVSALLLSRSAFAQTHPADPAPQLDRVERLIQRGDDREAFNQALHFAIVHKQSPQRDRALFLIAQALFRRQDGVKAFYYLDELMDEYPDSQLYYAAIDLQFQIADAYLKGMKLKFVGIPMFSGEDEGIEMLYRIQNRSPGSPLAEKSLLRSADFYYDDKQYDFAADTYAAYLRSYPRSPIAGRIRLRQAFSSYAQFHGPKFDATPVIDAREQLRTVMAENEKLASDEEVPKLLERIDSDLARKLLITGDFYRRTHEPRGAAYTYRYIAKAFPQTPQAKLVDARLQELPAWARQAAPEPAITPGFAPGSPAPDELHMSQDKQQRK